MFGRTTTVQIEANVPWEVARDPDSGLWIGVCHPLNLNAIGETWEDLFKSAGEAMNLLLQDLFAEGELNSFLARNNWRLMSPLPKAGAKARFDVPFSLNQSQMHKLVTSNA